MPNPGIHAIEFCGQHLVLHPFRTMYWQEAESLLLADLHLGKAAHFRRAGIPVPAAVGDANLDKLISVLLEFQPKRVLFLGDLFHSEFNRQWMAFSELLDQFAATSFELIVGNHDILDRSFYRKAGLVVHENGLQTGPFWLTHHPEKNYTDVDAYNLAGHVHPAVRLRGNGRQRLRLPCFYFGKNQGLLPAFGEFTGSANLETAPEDQVFVIAEDTVVPLG